MTTDGEHRAAIGGTTPAGRPDGEPVVGPGEAGADGVNRAVHSSMPVPAKGKAPMAQDTQELPATPGAGPSYALDDFDDDWDDDEIERSRHFDAKARARARRVTGVLALVAALGVGFASGIFYQKHSGSSATTSGTTPNFAALRAAFAGGGSGGAARSGGALGGGGGGFAAAFGGGNSVIGTVSAVAGGTLYVSQGTSSALVKVVTGPTSTVTVPSTGSIADIQPGDSVIISGAKQKDGSYMAATVTDRGASTTGGGGAAAAPGG